jgi:hypothetical protein
MASSFWEMRAFLIFVSSVFFFGTSPFLVYAETSTGGTFSVSPLFTDISVGEGETAKDFELSVSNGTADPVVLRLSLIDFGSLNESGGIAFLGKEANGVNRYALAYWIVPEKDVVTLLPGSEEKLRFTLENRESLSPGGHYGAVLFSVENEGGNQQGSPSAVSVSSTFSALIFARKEGGILQEFSFKEQGFERYSWWSGLPMGISLRFQNSGNVDIVPRGRAMLVDPFGRVVAKGIINEDSARILPESFRVYHLKLSPLSAYVLPGPYTVMTEYRFDGQDAFQTIPEQRVFAWGIAFWWLVGIGAISFGIRTLRRKLKSTRTL